MSKGLINGVRLDFWTSKKSNLTPGRGFTLLEMIVAISIFSIIAIVSYASLNRFLDQRDWIETKNEKLKQLQIAYLVIGQDLRRLSPRIVRDGFGDAEPLFIAMSPTDTAIGEVLRFKIGRAHV